MNRAKTLVLTIALVVFAIPSFAAQDTDNTKVNKQPSNKSTMTADSAKNGKSDLQLMKEIRRAVVKDKSLSTYAHNVKIVAKDGKVTLKGPVKSDDEKTKIAKIATEVAGSDSVTNELTVSGSNQ